MTATATSNERTRIFEPDRSPVLQLIARRLAENSLPGARQNDDRENRLALVIEGGGMRGVVSAGMVTALNYLQITPVFDLVVGTSAGAMNGAWLLSGKPAFGTSLYYQDLISKEWLDYRRVFRRRPIVGLDYLMDTLMTEVKTLDCQRVFDSGIPLYAVAARLPDYSVHVLSDFASPDELRHALRASARIPVASGNPVQIDGEELVDGSMASSIPVITAVRELGATHVLALLTRPKGHLRGRPSLMHKILLQPLMNRMLKGLGDADARKSERYAAEVAYLEKLEQGDDGGARAFTIQVPADSARISQLEQNALALFGGAATGANAVYDALTGETHHFYPGLTIAQA